MPVKLLIDCDPGLDDALALLLAHGDPNLELVAVTTVGGNVGVDKTTKNALELRDYLGFRSVPISAGAGEPLRGTVKSAEHVHGEGGLGDVILPTAKGTVDDRSAVDLIVEALANAPGEIHLVATGPLTNIALALRREPRIIDWAASFTIMGGSYTRGNATPAAEFNIYADPDAASEVFEAGWTVTMVGLDLTLQAVVNETIEHRMNQLGELGADFVRPLATFWTNPFEDEWDGQALHDVCAVAFVARPDLFVSKPARVDVETSGEFTSGETVVDFHSEHRNALIPMRLDVPGFWDYVLGAWSNVTPQK
ncbi:MAG TPA: nucleoside hydrolase [Galbitalea sp.]|jgi:purine nucleosidase|nr:nucleoside hydrolase [Galbitalea sp.]